MNVLIGCEYSGIVRTAFWNKGHYAYSCDLLPDDHGSKFHFQRDVFDMISTAPSGVNKWDLIILHPPCVKLCVSGNAHYGSGKSRYYERIDALQWTLNLWNHAKHHAEKICLENPVGILSKHIGKPHYVQPHNFGHDASKKTGLFLHNLEPLEPTGYIEPRIIDGLPRWENQTDSGQNRLGPSPDRWKIRSTTYKGIADAMAEQWGGA